MKKQGKNISKLNKKQLEAIKHGKGPLLIIAGAGTGKTTVITERIKYLITQNKAKPEEILALTFTEKAAMEMEERVDRVMPLSYGDIWIMTFHSFCDQILRESGLHIGLPTNFKLMTKEKSIDLFKRNLFEFSLDYFRPLGNPNKFVDSILSHFSRLQDEVVTPSEYLTWTTRLRKNSGEAGEEKLEYKKWNELAVVYKEYDNLKLKEAKLDFGDLIIKSIELFQKRPNVLKDYQQKFKYILVDEYQDTNFAQNELVNLLVGKEKHLPAGRQVTVVGDDNQSIYRFRGAAISNILKFKKTYKNAKTITLNKNYRSTQKILESAYKLIKHNDPDTLEYRLKISKKLESVSKNKNIDPELIFTENGGEEAESVAEKIIQLNTKGKYNWKDFAVLVRANNHADIFTREFERRGVPYQFLGPSKLFEKEEITDLISYLKSLYDPEDSESFYRFLSSDFFGIKTIDLVKVSSLARKNSISIYEAASSSDAFDKPLKIFNKQLKQINKKTAGEILFEYLQEVEIYEQILKNEEEIKAKNIATFFDKVKAFENDLPAGRQETPIFHKVVDYINLLLEVGESPSVSDGDWQENNAVNILTVHSSKGLEFPVVFLVNLVSDRFPSRNRSDALPIPNELIKEELPQGDFHLQEERRLFYVGMTRAKERLFLTAAKIYGDGKRQKKISPFVYEALGGIDDVLTLGNKKIKVANYSNTKNKPQKKNHKLKINYLSVSQIETFKTCPLHYKLKYIYNFPTSMSASISFGISIHETLKDFFETKKDILKIFKNNFLEEGYLNKSHKQKFYKKGENYLLGFLKNSYDEKIETVALEEKFTIKISDDLKIGGKVDRLDKLSGGRYEIIDYKTGANIPTQKEVDKDLQLSVYAMAVSEMYNVKPEDLKLSLYYLDTQEKISTTRTKKDLGKVKQEILEVKKEIEKSDFKCSNSYFCQIGCEFSMFCKSGD